MLQFTHRPQRYPEVRDARARIGDFDEISATFEVTALAEQAARCSQCGVPFCQVHCPLSNNIPDWLRFAAEGRMEEAYQLASHTNTFPEICGRICPQDRLCEGNCVIEKDFGAVTIGAVEKNITETAFLNGWVAPIRTGPATGFSVGVIGAGPAGLAAAHRLREQGHAVTVYDRHDRVGGLLIYGIPNFKLEKQVVQRRERWLRDSGIVFELNVAMGRDTSFAQVRARHDAVLIATGVYQARQFTQVKPRGVIPAMAYLTTSNRVGLGDAVAAYDSGEMNAYGKRIVVIGGGDTAMDCVRTAIRQGAQRVTCLYRRTRTAMPGSQREVAHAEAEGVQFTWLAAPLTYEGDGVLRGITCQRMNVVGEDAARARVVAIEGETFTHEADMAIEALGYDAEDLPTLWSEPALTMSKHGTLTTDSQGRTSLAGVYAAGDIVRGASLVVWAIRDGREIAQTIGNDLRAKAEIAA